MVIVITGPSHVGKTNLAQRLLEIKKFPYLSIDHLKMGLIRSHNTNLTPYDDDKLTHLLWPIVQEMIKTAIENHQNLIVEGCYIPSSWQSDFDNSYLKKITFIAIAFSDNYIEKNYNDIIKYQSVIEERISDEVDDINKVKEDNHH